MWSSELLCLCLCVCVSAGEEGGEKIVQTGGGSKGGGVLLEIPGNSSAMT